MDEGGAPIAGAFVIANRVGPSALGKSSRSATDGAFNVPNLPDGSYTLCVKSPAVARLDPCEWSAAPTTAVLSGGKSSAGNRLIVKKASTLQVRIEDPNHHLAPRSSTNEAPQIVMGVLTPAGTTSPAVLLSTDRTGRTYQITTGFDLPLTFTLSAKHLKIVDESGFAAQNNGSLRSFQHASGASSQPSFTYTVVGRTD